MKWSAPLVKGSLVKRYKRFLADFLLPDGSMVTAHCANTGSMSTCLAEDAPCLLTYHDDPKRKLKYSWQAIRMPDGWVGINTALANKLVVEAVKADVIKELAGYRALKTEKKYGANSRVDLFLSEGARDDCYVEIKNVTLLLEDGVVAFPDTVTERGNKHLHELIGVRREGYRAVLLYCVQRESARRVLPAERFDPEYTASLRTAVSKGLEVYAYQAVFRETGITLDKPLPVLL